MKKLLLPLLILLSCSCVTKVQIFVINDNENLSLEDITQKGSKEPGSGNDIKIPLPGA